LFCVLFYTFDICL